jgi:hypothetical protein
VIQASNSEWSSAPVLVRKKDGSVRWCVDYRALNDKTVKDSFPLPNINDCLDALAGTQYFSTLDMASGYYQIEIAEEDRKKTAFISRYGLHEHTRMAFGLCNAPATFQRAIQLVLRGMTWEKALAYLDDINVLGKDFEDELHNLKGVFDRLRKYNLKLKPKKCHLFKTECEFLGKLINRQGVHVTQSKVEAVQKWPVPTCQKDVESFLGFVNYHRDHIQGYAGISKPLYGLTGKCPKFEWKPEHQEAFELLRDKVISAPCLMYPRPEGKFILDTDASNSCIGAELAQEQDGTEKVIAYASKILTPTQQRYCTTRKELLAVITFCRQFRHYLLGRRFTVRTDHHSLVWLLRFRNADGQLCRWLEELAQYDMEITHRPGRKHSNADGLSRIPDTLDSCDCYRAGAQVESLPCGGCSYCQRAHNQWARFHEDVDDVIPLSQHGRMIPVTETEGSIRAIQVETVEANNSRPELQPLADNWMDGYSKEDLREHQLKDSDLHPIIEWLEAKICPSQPELYLQSPATKYLWLCRQQLKMVQGVLFYLWDFRVETRYRLVVPQALKDTVLRQCHDIKSSGHQGRDKTRLILKRSFMWYGMTVDAEIYVKQCAICSVNKKACRRPMAPMEMHHAGFPMERVHLDVLGPFTTSLSGNKYILVMIDQFSKWIEAVAIPETNAEYIAHQFLLHFVVTFGCPLTIHTDQGSNFDGQLFRAFCKLLQIAKTRSSPYHPSSNGQVERCNRTLLQMIRCYVEGNVRYWDRDLPILVMALHATENQSTGFTPNMIMLGKEVITPAEVIMGIADVNQQQYEAPKWIQHLQEVLRKTHALARNMLQAKQRRQKNLYDLRVAEKHYNVGDVLYMRDDSSKVGESKKLRSPWKGPYLVVKANPLLYTLADRKREKIYHHDRLKLCED